MAQVKIMQPGPSWCKLIQGKDRSVKDKEKLTNICLLILDMVEGLIAASAMSEQGKRYFLDKGKKLKSELEKRD